MGIDSSSWLAAPVPGEAQSNFWPSNGNGYSYCYSYCCDSGSGSVSVSGSGSPYGVLILTAADKLLNAGSFSSLSALCGLMLVGVSAGSVCVCVWVCVCMYVRLHINLSVRFSSLFFFSALSCRSCTHFSTFFFCYPGIDRRPSNASSKSESYPLTGLIGRRRIYKQYTTSKKKIERAGE